MIKISPVKEKLILSVDHFPTTFQALIFRVWEMVNAKRIAEVINTDEKTVKELAMGMGLGEQRHLEKWGTRGYISIIRNVWNILPYDQLCLLLGWDEQRLEYVLKEDDFLYVKLGDKFDCDRVEYRPLTQQEKEMTSKIKQIVEHDILPLDKNGIEPPFDFFNTKRYKKIVHDKTKAVTIDSSWGMIVEGDKRTHEFADDFKNEISEVYNIELSNKSTKNIIIKPDIINNDEEYHEIDITNDSILIRGSSAIGIFRGLNYLLDMAKSCGKLSFDVKSYKRKTRFKTRFIYSFCGLYADVLDKDSKISFPDELLKQYARSGVNGVWIQGILYTISPYPFKKGMDNGWEKRLENLKIMVERLDRYGIKLYLYINEPRRLHISDFKDISHLMGRIYGNEMATLCTSHPEVQKYLSHSIETICKAVPELGGFVCITQSENNVSCVSSPQKESDNPNECLCPVCKHKSDAEVTAELINSMVKPIEKINNNIKFIMYTWNWSQFEDDLSVLMSELPKNVIIMSVSETQMPYNIGGVKGEVSDYSMSIVGPGEMAKNMWQKAREQGLSVGAKIQINNTWECSTAPFLPVYEKIIEHMQGLMCENIEHLMLSWTLGGYISDNIRIASGYFFEDTQNPSNPYEEVLVNNYGEYADKVKKAVSYFCEGFSEFPFSLACLYKGPSNAGASNLLYPKATGLRSTMTCYPYDDLYNWRGWGAYPEDVFLDQFEKLCKKWELGLKCLDGMPLCEFYDMAYYGYTLFKSSANQVKYYILRDSGKSDDELKKVVESEREMALKAYEIMLRNSAVGYEAANHYYVSRSTLREKIVQCTMLYSK